MVRKPHFITVGAEINDPAVAYDKRSVTSIDEQRRRRSDREPDSMPNLNNPRTIWAVSILYPITMVLIWPFFPWPIAAVLYPLGVDLVVLVPSLVFFAAKVPRTQRERVVLTLVYVFALIILRFVHFFWGWAATCAILDQC